MHDVKFTTQLATNELLPGSVNDYIQSIPTKSERADYFLRHIITISLETDETEEFTNLISVMEKCEYPHIKRWAKNMKSDLEKELKGNYILAGYNSYVYKK